MLATAEVVLTLTPGAADEIADRFGRTAIVVAHPSVAVPDPDLGAERGLVGLRLRPPAPGGPRRRALVRAALSGAVSGGGRLRVLADDERHAAGRSASWPTAATSSWSSTPPTERPAQLQQLHVAVLPEPLRHALAATSRSAATSAPASSRPRCGWFAEQWSEVVPVRNRRRAAGSTRSRSPAPSRPP